jgi:hypothetical protein
MSLVFKSLGPRWQLTGTIVAGSTEEIIFPAKLLASAKVALYPEGTVTVAASISSPKQIKNAAGNFHDVTAEMDVDADGVVSGVLDPLPSAIRVTATGGAALIEVLI